MTMRLSFVFAELDRTGDFGDRRFALGLARFEDFFDARKTGDDVFGRDAAGVEGAQRELRARFADRLRGDDADRLADVDLVAGREIAAVAHRADAVLRLAREHRADLHRRDAGGDDRLGLLFVDLFVAHDDLRASDASVSGSLMSSAARRPMMRSVERFDDFLADADVADGDAVAWCRNLPRG